MMHRNGPIDYVSIPRFEEGGVRTPLRMRLFLCMVIEVHALAFLFVFNPVALEVVAVLVVEHACEREQQGLELLPES